MTTLEKLRDSMFPDIYNSFFREDDPSSSKEDWKNLFNYMWKREEDSTGYVLVDQSDIVGVLGMIFSKRIIDEKEYKFCNLHNWQVKEKYRGRSLLLMKPVLNLNDYTVTDFTPTGRVCTISKKLGFKELDSTLRIFFPKYLSNNISRSNEFQIITDEETIKAALKNEHLRIFCDHQSYGCAHMLVRSKANQNDYCYIVYTSVSRYIRPYCYIHYLSNTNLFERAYKLICSRLSRLNNCSFTVIDNRLLSNKRFPLSFKFPFQNRQLFLSSSVQAKNIDTLYSEVVFLKLCTFPDLSKMIGRWFQNIGLKKGQGSFFK